MEEEYVLTGREGEVPWIPGWWMWVWVAFLVIMLPVWAIWLGVLVTIGKIRSEMDVEKAERIL